MSQISSNSQRRSPWKIAQQSKSIIKDQSSINIYKLPSKFEPSKTNLLNETKNLNKSIDRRSHSQIFSSNPLQTQNTVLAQNDKSFLHSRINLNLKPKIIKDSPQKKRNDKQPNNKELPLPQLAMMNRMINDAPMRSSLPGDNKNAFSKIKSQFIIFKQRVLKQLKQLSQMIERVRLDNAHQIQRGLKQIELLALNQIIRDNKINKDTKNTKDINIDCKIRQQQQKEQIMKNITRQKIIKLQANVIKLHFNLTKPNFHSFNGSFGCIDTNQPTSTINLSQSQIKKTIQSPKANRKLQFQYEKTDNIINIQLRKSFVRQQNGEGNIKSTLDKCNHMVQTIVTLSEINASPVINRSNSNDNLMVQQYKRKLLQISKSNEKLIQQQARKKYKVQPKLKVNQKLQKFYTAIEKLKQDVNEIRNISDIKQVRKKNI